MTPWLYLLLAGIFETGFAVSMKLMNNHKNIPWSIAFYISIILSFIFLQQAIKTIPIGTAYAIWTGIGTVGVVTIGMLYLKEPVSLMRIFFLLLLVSSIIGLKLISKH